MKKLPKITLGRPHSWREWEYSAICMLTGGIGYGLLEVLWRGYTHISMIVTGGVCLTAISLINRKLKRVPFLLRCLICTAFVITAEFFVGILVNRILHLCVWDYSASRFNLLGQICLEFSFIWFLLCLLISLAMSLAFRKERV